MELVSVLLPTYNSGKYLKEAIDSIINQTYTHFELLILDDGSTDNTADIIERYSDNRIIYHNEQTNRGIVYQLNKGIDLAKGSFIARMDADDRALPNRFERQLAFLNNIDNQAIEILGTNAVSIGNKNLLIEFKNYKPSQISFLLNFCCPILHPTVMFRSRVFKTGIKYPSGFLYAEDFALWRILDNGRNIAILDEVLLEYRIHKDQTNKNNERFAIQRESSIRIILESKNIKLISILDNLLLKNKEKAEIIIDKWFGLDVNKKVNSAIRFYIKIRKKMLGIRSELINQLIY